ncbi:MAG: PAS domain S-box protein [Ignavibacteriaceae bacterium]
MPDKLDPIDIKSIYQGSEINFTILAEKSLVGIYLIQDGVFKYLNPKLAEIFEYTVEELLNKKGPKDLTLPADRYIVDKHILNRMCGDIQSVNYEFRGITKNNVIRFIEVFGSRTTYNKKPAVLGTLLDITERKNAVDEIKKSEKRYKDLAEMLPQMIFELDSEGKITYANINVNEKIGCSCKEIEYGISLLQFIDTGERERAADDIAEIMNGKTLYNREYTILRKDGFTFPAEISASPIYAEDLIIGLRGFIIDKTESKKSEEQLRVLSRAVQQSPASVIITDLDGNIEYINPKFQQVTGYSLDEIKFKNPRILSSGLKPASEYEILWNTITSGNDWTGEFQNKKKNGEIYWASALISPVKDNDGKITHFLGLQEDITGRKRSEMELKAAKDKAEEMNRMKSIFLANMSHELRTPMTGIMGYTETLYNELKDSHLKEMAGTLLKISSRLKETLNLILDLSRIEANKIEINSTNIYIPEILRETVKLFEIAAIEKKLELDLTIKDENISSMLDRRMFVQIIENLINNAIKYTNIGKVAVTAGKKIENRKEFSIIEIEDTGIGIQSEDIEVIFEPFRQLSEGNARSFEGTGLGLTITKKFVELLGGNIFVQSRPGTGSKFTVKFPSIAPAEYKNNVVEEKEIKMVERKGKYSLLLVENDVPSIDIIKIYLQEGYTVDFALDGLTALQMVGKKKYDAVLMDIDLGFGMNGLEVTQKIKELKSYENVPIIAVTAYAMLGDREKFLSAGCTHYIAKPFDKIALIDLLEGIF